jgi:hypothetical protein
MGVAQGYLNHDLRVLRFFTGSDSTRAMKCPKAIRSSTDTKGLFATGYA